MASVAPNEPLVDKSRGKGQPIEQQNHEQKKSNAITSALPSSKTAHPPPSGEPSKTASSSTPTLLDELLLAVQRKDVAGGAACFFAWTDVLGNPDSADHAQAVEEFSQIPSPVLSEIIRSMDPMRRPELDKAYGLNITQGHAQYTDAGKLFDDFGVRLHHRRVLQGMLSIVALREDSSNTLRPADFDVFIRCAGAAADYRFTAIMFGEMKRHGLIPQRTDRTWVEFLKARFMMEPAYYQYDRSRIAVDPRNLITHEDVKFGHKETLKRIDRIRLSTNALMRKPWNRMHDQPGQDIRRILRKSAQKIILPTPSEAPEEFEDDGVTPWEDQERIMDQARAEAKASQDPKNANVRELDYRSFSRHWKRSRRYPNESSEEMASAAMIGFSRSNSRHAILDVVFKGQYGITVDEESHVVKGGHNLEPGSALYPTSRLLNAIVESFGSMSEISLAMKLLDYVSQRYNVPITHDVWSNLLNWSYLSASKKNQRVRKMLGTEVSTHLDVQDVIHVWNVMTSEPYSVQPTFEDLDIYIRTLIITRRHDEANKLIRESVMPYLDSLVDKFESAVCEEILIKDAIIDQSTESFSASTVSQAIRLRQDAEVRKDYVENRIAIWFKDLLKEHSKGRNARRSHSSTVLIPNLIRDFPRFFLTVVRYRTATGAISLNIGNETNRIKFKEEGPVAREVIPTKIGSISVPSEGTDMFGVRRKIADGTAGGSYEDPEFTWRTVNKMTIVDNVRIPRQRIDELTEAPSPDAPEQERRRWWGLLETQLMM